VAAAASSAWRWMLGLGTLPPAAILLSLAWLPESPRYLVATGKEAAAAEVLGRIYTPEEAAATMSVMLEERRETKTLPLCAGLRRVFLPPKGAPRAMIIAGLGCAFWQQATGVEAAVYYTPETLEAAGITDESQLLLATVGVGLIKVAFIVIAASLVESYGRVRLLLISTAAIGLSQALLALSFVGGRTVWLALFGQCLFMAAFSIGAGPCSMLVASECFPLQVRGFALGVATMLNRTTSGLVAVTFLSLSRALTPAGAYFLFVCLAAMAYAFIAARVPETKGKSLEEIEVEMAERYAQRTQLISDGRGGTIREVVREVMPQEGGVEGSSV